MIGKRVVRVRNAIDLRTEPKTIRSASDGSHKYRSETTK
jgi:hypothetical protein